MNGPAPGRLAAVALGLALASLPFVQFGLLGGHAHEDRAHADHAPRHGGLLQMVGDHHLEVVATPEDIRVYVSDAWRRPLHPPSATARFDGAEESMTWHVDHFAVPQRERYALLEVSVLSEAGTDLPLTLTHSALDARLPGR